MCTKQCGVAEIQYVQMCGSGGERERLMDGAFGSRVTRAMGAHATIKLLGADLL